MTPDEKHARFMAAVRAADPKALEQVAKTWNGTTAIKAAKTLGVTTQTLRNWRRQFPELRKLLAVGLVLLAVGCTDEDAASKTLDANGFTDVEFTGYDWLDCSEDDFSHTGFRAKNAQGKQVEGVVCCGLFFKSCTVRF